MSSSVALDGVPQPPAAPGVGSVTATAPLASSGGLNPDISVIPGTIAGQVLTWDGAAWVAAAPGGLTADRRDHSVNGAFVEGWNTPSPIFRGKTNVNPAGGYTGGGIGNKAILGHWLPASMPLSALSTIEFTVEQLTPEAGVTGNTIPYVNLVVELDPLGPHAGVYTIFSMMSRDFVTLNLGAFVDAAPLYTVTWDAALHFAQVVLDRGLYRTSLPLPVWDPPFPLVGPPGQFVAPAAFIPPNVGGNPPVGSWTQRSYTMASILAFFPLARIVNANSLDGGLPKLTSTSGVMLALGDSASVKQNAVQLLDWKLNGVSL